MSAWVKFASISPDITLIGKGDSYGLQVGQTGGIAPGQQVEQEREQQGDAECRQSDALEDAERARDEARVALLVERVADQRKTEQGKQGARRAPADEETRHENPYGRPGEPCCSSRSTSSRRVCRTSLPCTM